MKLLDLRDKAKSDDAADDAAGAALSQAQLAKAKTAGDKGASHVAFAHAIQAKGGEVVGVASATVYRSAPGAEDFTSVVLTTLDAEVEGPATFPVPSA